MLIELAYEPEIFDGMRRDKSNLDLFRTLVKFCLVHCCNSFIWRYKVYNTEIYNICIESDEALAMLLFENIAEDLMGIFKGGKELARKESKITHTKSRQWNRKIQRLE